MAGIEAVHEGFGLPLLEAMAYGRPVAARASAIPEIVGDGEMLPAARADSLAQLLGNPTRRPSWPGRLQ